MRCKKPFRRRKKTHRENTWISVANWQFASAFTLEKDLISVYAARNRKRAYE
jgi:hypothetical protein